MSRFPAGLSGWENLERRIAIALKVVLVYGALFIVYGSGLRVEGCGLRVYGLELRVCLQR